MEFLLMRISCAVMLSIGAVTGQNPLRGPHHPRGEPLPPGAHRHHRPPEDKLTKDAELLHDTVHLQEDLGIPIENMSEEELEFHYFNLHDFDNNKRLDGLELLKAIYHTLDHNHHEDDHSHHEVDQSHETVYDFVEEHDSSYLSPLEEEVNKYIELIDKLLEEDDLDKDGFISYPEFSKGRAKGKREELTAKLLDKPALHDDSL